MPWPCSGTPQASARRRQPIAPRSLSLRRQGAQRSLSQTGLQAALRAPFAMAIRVPTTTVKPRRGLLWANRNPDGGWANQILGELPTGRPCGVASSITEDGTVQVVPEHEVAIRKTSHQAACRSGCCAAHLATCTAQVPCPPDGAHNGGPMATCRDNREGPEPRSEPFCIRAVSLRRSSSCASDASASPRARQSLRRRARQ